LKIFCGTANEPLCDEICQFLGLQRGQAHLTRFSDGEVYLQILENVRGADVFVVQPTCYPVDQHLMELLLMIDALKRASARRITAVVPYFGYARQDRKDKPRVAVSAKLVADLLTTAGTHRALWLTCTRRRYKDFSTSRWIIVRVASAGGLLPQTGAGGSNGVSPDAGGVERARFVAKKMDAAWPSWINGARR